MAGGNSFARRLYLLEKQVFNVATQVRLGFSSIEGGYIDGYDNNGGPTVIVGELPDGSTGSADLGGPNPPVPIGLEFSGGIRSLVFNWGGEYEGGVTSPMNFARIEIHVGTSPTFIPDVVGPTGGSSSTMKGTIETPRGGGLVIGGFDPPGGDPDDYPDYFACLVARSTSGKYSDHSEIIGPVVPVNITKIELEDFTVTADDIAAEAVTAEKVFPGAIVAGKIATNAILAVNIQANAINTAHLQANAVTANELAANSVTASEIAANAVTAGALAANSVTAAAIAAGTITANEIAAGAITTLKLSATAIDGMTITGALMRSGSGGTRVEISAAGAGNVIFYNSGSQVGFIGPTSGGLTFGGPGPGYAVLTSTELELFGGAALLSDGGLFDKDLVGGGTTAGSVNNNGRLIRTPSSARFKENVDELSLELCRKALEIIAVQFQFKDRSTFGNSMHPGAIAEQLHDIGAGLWVDYDEEGLPAGIRYPELTVAVCRILRDFDERLVAIGA